MDETIQPQPKRRRSSILPRRSIAPPPIPVVDDNANDSKALETNRVELRAPSSSEGKAVDISHLKSQLINLTTEQLAWRNLRAERKLLRTSADRILAPPQLSWDSAQEFLSNEDKRLLENLPSYDDIYANYDNLMVETARLQVKYKRTSNLARSIQHLAQCRLHSMKVKIGEYSENNLDVPALTENS